MAVSNPVNSTVSVHDIKEVSKRTTQLGIVAVTIAFLVAVYYFFLGIYISSLLIGGYCIFLVINILLNKAGYFKYSNLVIICATNVLLICTVTAEGLRAHGYMFFLPLLFSIPFIVENNKSFNKELLFYFIITILSYSYCIFFIDEQSQLQYISESGYRIMSYTNTFSAFILTAGFACTTLFFERKYARALLEEKNRVEEALHSRSKFLSYMGHELRTPLNGIIGNINILNREKMLPEQQPYFEVLKYCSDHLLHQVNDILDFSKIEAGKLELNNITFNLRQLVANSALPFYTRFNEKNLELQVNLESCPDIYVSGDDVRLVQIINNLISNAYKFTEAGSVVVTATSNQVLNNQVAVTISVKDTGIGIEEEDQIKIFENFSQVFHESTRQFGGTGLGISICERLLNLMNSRLNLVSQLGQGSEFSFTITLPVVKKEKVHSPEVKTYLENLSGIKVLVAEDNLFNMMIIEKMLQDWQVCYTTATNGYEVMASLEEDAAFDIILLDLQMPEMDGYTAMQQIKNLYPHIPVLAFTASLVDNTMLQELLTYGFADCILKPFQMDDLIAKIKKHLLIKA